MEAVECIIRVLRGVVNIIIIVPIKYQFHFNDLFIPWSWLLNFYNAFPLFNSLSQIGVPAV